MESYGISIDEPNKTITLNGNQNPLKTKIEDVYVVELISFGPETDFHWFQFEAKNYKIILENVNIHNSSSINFLILILSHKFKVIIKPTSHISLEALNTFSHSAPFRNSSDFADLISEAGFPIQGGFNGSGLVAQVKTTLKQKGYTFDEVKK